MPRKLDHNAPPKPGHGSDGRFLKAHPIDPGTGKRGLGKPNPGNANSRGKMLRQMFINSTSRVQMGKMIAMLKRLALGTKDIKPDLKALELLLAYVVGKPTEKIDLETTGPLSTVDIRAIIMRELQVVSDTPQADIVIEAPPSKPLPPPEAPPPEVAITPPPVNSAIEPPQGVPGRAVLPKPATPTAPSVPPVNPSVPQAPIQSVPVAPGGKAPPIGLSNGS
jgi:hypothetical protein